MPRPRFEGFRRFIADRRAESGMGALLVFIASILVAAVAAGVIIQTTYMAQQKAQTTAELSIKDVSNGFKILAAEGEIEGGYLKYIYLKVALHAGSDPIDLSNVIIEITDGTNEASLQLNDTWLGNLSQVPGADDLQSAKNSATVNETFTVLVLRDPDNHFAVTNPVVTQGTLLKIVINVSGWNIGSQKEVTIKIIPKHGVPTLEEFVTPPTFAGRTYVSLV